MLKTEAFLRIHHERCVKFIEEPVKTAGTTSSGLHDTHMTPHDITQLALAKRQELILHHFEEMIHGASRLLKKRTPDK